MYSQERLKDSNDYAPQDDFNINILPIIHLIDPYHENKECLFSKEKLIFCHRAVLKTIDSCLAGRYSDFDGHTTSNCCHGLALLSRLLINSVLELDLRGVEQEGKQKLEDIENCKDEKLPCQWWIPQSLVYLSSLFLLNFIKEFDPTKGFRTFTKKFRLIGPISMNLCKQISRDLQTYFANLVAERYAGYLDDIPVGMEISGAPVAVWGKYISSDYIRMDQRGIKYASNLFSMQVSFAHLARFKAKVALINDIIDFQGNPKGRYVVVFEGDGEGGFRACSLEEISLFDKNEPVVVFGGCVYSDHVNVEAISLLMQPWLENLSNLLLACDVFYPQFPKVADDPNFDSSPIAPEEELLKEIISGHLNCPGVSAADPSVYCAAHIFPASLGQVLHVLTGEDVKALPMSFIPDVKLTVLSAI